MNRSLLLASLLALGLSACGEPQKPASTAAKPVATPPAAEAPKTEAAAPTPAAVAEAPKQEAAAPAAAPAPAAEMKQDEKK